MAENNEPNAASAAPVLKADLTGLQPRPLRILVASSSSVAGASTIAENVLLPALGCKHLYVVESPHVAATRYGVPVNRFDADELPRLRSEILEDGDAIVVDLNGSELGNFIEALSCESLFPMFDHCVVVADPSYHAQAAAVRTYQTFRQLGMADGTFRLVLNRVAMSIHDQEAAVVAQFPVLFEFAEMNPAFWIHPGCRVPELRTLFTQLREVGRSLGEVLTDQTDYEELAYVRSCAGDEAGANDAARRGVVAQYAVGAQVHFKRAYELLDLRPGKTADASA
jgi:hypothetical protein